IRFQWLDKTSPHAGHDLTRISNQFASTRLDFTAQPWPPPPPSARTNPPRAVGQLVPFRRLPLLARHPTPPLRVPAAGRPSPARLPGSSLPCHPTRAGPGRPASFGVLPPEPEAGAGPSLS